jgi:hypothetical protein
MKEQITNVEKQIKQLYEAFETIPKINKELTNYPEYIQSLCENVQKIATKVNKDPNDQTYSIGLVIFSMNSDMTEITVTTTKEGFKPINATLRAGTSANSKLIAVSLSDFQKIVRIAMKPEIPPPPLRENKLAKIAEQIRSNTAAFFANIVSSLNFSGEKVTFNHTQMKEKILLGMKGFKEPTNQEEFKDWLNSFTSLIQSNAFLNNAEDYILIYSVGNTSIYISLSQENRSTYNQTVTNFTIIDDKTDENYAVDYSSIDSLNFSAIYKNIITKIENTDPIVL